MTLTDTVLSGRTGRLERIWTARCEHPTSFSSVAKFSPGIAFHRADGITTLHLRGVETRATTLHCQSGAEYFGGEFRLGAYLPAFPPAQLANLQDALLPTLPDGRIVLAGREWEMPTPENLDVFVGRLERAGLLVFDPLVEEVLHGGDVPERTAQSRFRRAVGLSAAQAAGDRAGPRCRPAAACGRGDRGRGLGPRLLRPAAPDPHAACADRTHAGRAGDGVSSSSTSGLRFGTRQPVNGCA